jgi:hypothetical protein
VLINAAGTHTEAAALLSRRGQGGAKADGAELFKKSFDRAVSLPKEVQHWLLATLREKLVKIGAKVIRHGR